MNNLEDLCKNIPGTSDLFFEHVSHVHIHGLTSDEDIIKGKDGISEICCHGCGISLFIIFSYGLLIKYPNGVPEIVSIRDSFLKDHEECSSPEERDIFKEKCPHYRRSTSTIDLKYHYNE